MLLSRRYKQVWMCIAGRWIGNQGIRDLVLTGFGWEYSWLAFMSN
jgi:hypothetical protein